MKQNLEYELNDNSPRERKRFIRKTFDSIAGTYDVLNRILSFGVDLSWRRYALGLLGDVSDKTALDICSGTGDFSSLLSQKGASVVSLDFSLEMLARGVASGRISEYPVAADATQLPFRDGRFDAAVIAFGVRNIPDLNVFIDECFRVLRQRGDLVIVELTRPRNFFMRIAYRVYLQIGVPVIGGLVSGRLTAYRYLSKTIASFIDPENLGRMLERGGFIDVRIHRRFFGVATVIHCRRDKSARMTLQ
jgi:demethylmenaquinone methyltransferase/2-methoxy-6-polyprenyl-1,4-benzoquinol methylase